MLQPMPGMHCLTMRRLINPGLALRVILLEGNGRCLLLAFSISSPVQPGQIQVLLFRRIVRASIIGSHGTWATILSHGVNAVLLRRTIRHLACILNWWRRDLFTGIACPYGSPAFPGVRWV